jgi:hypothetical protein
MRPSSLLRNTRLNALLAALAVRDLGSIGTAALLDCSASSARNYLLELLDAGVVSAILNPAVGNERTVYRLNTDRLLVDDFQSTLAPDCGATAAARDPLVAALFGAPRPEAGSSRPVL